MPLPGFKFRLLQWANHLGQFDAVNLTQDIFLDPELSTVLDSDTGLWGCLLPGERRAVVNSLVAAKASQSTWKQRFQVSLPSGRCRWLQVYADCVDRQGDTSIWEGQIFDITDQVQKELQLASQALVLEAIANQHTLSDTLNQLIRGVEAQIEGMIGSIFLLDPTTQLVANCLGPHLPEAYRLAFNGEKLGDGQGSCGTAMARQQIVITEDIQTDPRWQQFRQVVLGFGLRACWSVPLISSQGLVLGSFGFYFKQTRSPYSEDLPVLNCAAHLAQIAIEQSRFVEALQIREQRFRQLFEAAPKIAVQGYNVDRQVIFWNSASERLYGYTAEEAIGQQLEDLIVPPEMRQEVITAVHNWVEHGQAVPPGELILQNRDGQPIPVFSSHVLLRNAHGEPEMYCVDLDLREHKLAQAALAESETQLRSLVEDLRGERDLLTSIMHTSVAAIVVLNPQGKITFANDSAKRTLGLTPNELTHRTYSDPEWRHVAMDGGVWREEDQPFRQVMRTGKPVFDVQHAIQWPDGRKKYLSVNGAPIKNAAGEITSLVFLVSDITDRWQTTQALRESEERFRLLAENMSDLVCLHEIDGRYCYVSPSCRYLLHYQPEELLGQDPYDFFHEDDRDRVRNESHRAALAGRPVPITYRMRRKKGDYIWLETLTRPICNDQGEVVQLQTTSRDVTDKVKIQAQLEHDALHDALTGLPNRNLLMERLEFALARSQRHPDYQFALLFLDLDRFKVINDSLGHQAGDRLLVALASLLQTTVRPLDLAARLGGDEFVLLLEEISDQQDVIGVVERIFAVLRSPIDLAGRDVFISTSVGVVIGPGKYRQASELLRDADIAMYRAKKRGKNRYELFSPTMHHEAVAQLQIEHDLRKALDHREFVLHYQPIVSLTNGKLAGFEALVRWHHPERGLVSPGAFIAIAEETGLIVPLGIWILRQACAQLQNWRQRFAPAQSWTMNVNLSVKQLREVDFLDVIDQILAETGLPGHCLSLEITEGMLIDDFKQTEQLLSQLKARSLHISVDDFGTGYSSLAYLHRLPMDALKIDRSFISPSHAGQSNGRQCQIAETIVTLAKQLGLSAIAEGIETQAQMQHLRGIGCDFGQGFLFAKPLSAAAVASRFLGREELFSSNGDHHCKNSPDTRLNSSFLIPATSYLDTSLTASDLD